MKGQTHKVTLLMNAGAKHSLKTLAGNTPLHLSCLGHERETATELLRRGADPNSINREMQTPLHQLMAAVHFGRPPARFRGLLDSLASHGADFTVKDRRARSLLCI